MLVTIDGTSFPETLQVVMRRGPAEAENDALVVYFKSVETTHTRIAPTKTPGIRRHFDTPVCCPQEIAPKCASWFLENSDSYGRYKDGVALNAPSEMPDVTPVAHRQGISPQSGAPNPPRWFDARSESYGNDKDI